MVRDGVLYTPPTSDSCLPGITRDSVIRIARTLGHEVREATLVRTDLYFADEAFLCGTAAEVTPIASVDGQDIGGRGPVTREIQEVFFATVEGRDERFAEFLEYPVHGTGGVVTLGPRPSRRGRRSPDPAGTSVPRRPRGGAGAGRAAIGQPGAGPDDAAGSRRRSPSRRHPARGGLLERHRRPARLHGAARRRPRRRGDHLVVLVHRLGQRGRCSSARRRCSPRSTSAPSTSIPTRSRRRSRRARRRSSRCTSSATRARSSRDQRDRRAATACRWSRTPARRSAPASTGRQVGTFGNPAVFGFYPNKQITTGEGGMITTDDPDVERELRSIVNQGRSDNGDWLGAPAARVQLPDGRDVGRGRARPAREAGADAGRPRRAVAARYSRAAGRRARRRAAVPRARTTRSWFIYYVRLDDEIDRTAVIEGMAGARHRHPALPAGDPPAARVPQAGHARGHAAGDRAGRPLHAGAAVLRRPRGRGRRVRVHARCAR